MKNIPFDFVLEELASAQPYTKPMFGCTSVYVGEKIVLILRQRESSPEDNGIWLATTEEHHDSLRKDFPSMRSIALFGPGTTGWQVLPMSAPDFEEAAFLACQLVLRNDPRIGKVPNSKKPRKAKASGARKGTSKKKATSRSVGKASGSKKRSSRGSPAKPRRQSGRRG